MSPSPRTDAADLITSIGRHWIWVLAFGILTLVAGVAAVAWPGPTVIAIAVLFGIQLVIVGIFQFVSAFAGGDRVRRGPGAERRAGFVRLDHRPVRDPPLCWSPWWRWRCCWASSGSSTASRRSSTRWLTGSVPHRGWTGFIGVLSILAGIVVLAYPGISLVTLALVLGVWLIIYGVMEIALAFRVRSAVGRVRHAVAKPG